MTWQGSKDSGLPGEPADDETRVDWSPPESSGAPQPPGPFEPPAPPATPVAPVGPGGYTYPAEMAEQADEAATWAPPPTPPTPPPASYPPPGSDQPPGGAWQPPVEVAPPPGSLKFGGVLPRVLAYWLDNIILSIGVGLIGGMLGAVFGTGLDSLVISAVLTTGISLLYFAGTWTSGGRATPGMRLFHLQVGRASDGRTLTIGEALKRWAAMGTPLTLVGVVPTLAVLASGVLMIWELVLLVSTAVSPTRQGIHDRVAGSAMVAPVGNEGPVVPCLVLAVILLVALPILAIVMLIALGDSVQQILTEVGTSI